MCEALAYQSFVLSYNAEFVTCDAHFKDLTRANTFPKAQK